MPNDFLTFKSLAAELNQLLSGGKIQKVTQPEKDEVRFSIYNNANYTLVVSANPNAPGIYITDGKKENPYSAPTFCMHLRKHLVGGTITGIGLYNGDRIFEIGILAKNEMMDVTPLTLFVELMGRYSNIILCGENNKISESLVHIGFDVDAKRVILPNVTYIPPQKGNKASYFEASKIRESLQNSIEENPKNALLSTVDGLSKPSAAELVYKSGLTFPYSENTVDKTVDEITNLFEIFGKSTYKPCVLPDYSDFFVTPYLSLCEEKNYLFYPTLTGAANACFTLRDKEIRIKDNSKEILTAARRYRDKLVKKIGIAKDKLTECDDMENVRISAELLTANLYKVKRGDSEITVENWYDDMRPYTVKLDVTKSPDKNSAALFNRYNKLKRAKEINIKQLECYTLELAYIESVLEELTRAENSDLESIKEELVSLKIIKPPQKKHTGKQPVKCAPKCFECEGFKVYVGTNNILNNEVTFKIGRSYDVWLHVKNHHGSHVIVRKNDESEVIPPSVLTVAAECAAYYSGADSSENVAVDFTERRFVRRIKESGPGMVTYDNYKTLYVTPKNHL